MADRQARGRDAGAGAQAAGGAGAHGRAARHVSTSVVEWSRDGAVFTDSRYSRAHRWSFDGGTVVPASASPLIVPLPLSSAAAVDPEEAFVASLSSCHMLWFLSLAAAAGLVVDAYRDEAAGTLGRHASGRLVMTEVLLRPAVRFAGRQPTAAEHAALHASAHDECFLAQSVTADVRCEPTFAGG